MNDVRVLLIGAGGLGTAVTWALLQDRLLGNGTFHLTIADPDHVALSNLHRQVLYRLADVGKPKGMVLRQHFPDWSIDLIPRRIETPVEIVEAAQDRYQLLIDGSDNFQTRFAANDAALMLGIPLIHGAVVGWRGQVLTVLPGISSCLRCLFDGPPALEAGACQREGVVGPVVAEIGWLMAMEANAILTGQASLFGDQLMTIEALSAVRRMVPLRKRSSCLGCGSL